MKPNVNTMDRVIRLIIGAIAIVLILTETVSGTWMYLTGAVALIMIVTSAVKFCPIYKVLGVSTCRK